MARQQPAGVLDARAPLEQRLEQVAKDGDRSQDSGKAGGAGPGPLRDERSPEGRTPVCGDKHPRDDTQDTGDRAFNGLSRAYPGRKFVAPECPAGKVGGDIGHPDQDK